MEWGCCGIKKFESGFCCEGDGSRLKLIFQQYFICTVTPLSTTALSIFQMVMRDKRALLHETSHFRAAIYML